MLLLIFFSVFSSIELLLLKTTLISRYKTFIFLNNFILFYFHCKQIHISLYRLHYYNFFVFGETYG